MTEKIKITVIFILSICCLQLYGGGGESTNVIVISIDTLRADRLGCYGYPRPTSPHIDELAEDSILFSHCYTLTPLTGPSFSTMLTSLPAYKHGAKRNGLPIYQHIKTLPFHMKKHGYYCGAFISNWPLRKSLSDLHRYFDDYVEVFTKKRWLGVMQPEGKAEDVTRNAIEWLEQHRGKKFFLWVHYSEPHAPYIYHKEFFKVLEKVPDSFYPPGTAHKKSDRYDTEIAKVDHHIGELIHRIKELNLYHDALVIFNSDHGESLGEHNYFTHGRKIYNSTMHVPLTVKLPQSHEKGAVIAQNVTLMSVAPTILKFMKLPVPAEMEGPPLPLWKDNREPNHPILVETYKGAARFKKNINFHMKVKPTHYGIIMGSRKLIYNTGSRKFEVYDLEGDRFEIRNLFYKQRRKFTGLQDQLFNHIDRVKKYIQYASKNLKQKTNLTSEDIEKLKTLGYID